MIVAVAAMVDMDMVMVMAVGRRSIRVLSSVSVERGIVVDSCGRISGKVRSDVSFCVLFCFVSALHCIAGMGMGKVYSIYHWLGLGGFVVLQLSVLSFCLCQYPIIVFSFLFFLVYSVLSGWIILYHTYHIISHQIVNGITRSSTIFPGLNTVSIPNQTKPNSIYTQLIDKQTTHIPYPISQHNP